MDKQKHRTHKNQRVRLKGEGQDQLYTNACAGSEGWVRNTDFDTQGYPMIYIEWDKDHWAYNGESDRWAFEAHYDIIEDNRMADTDKPDKNSDDDFMAFMHKAFEDYKGQSASADPEIPEPPHNTEVTILDGEHGDGAPSPEQFESEVDRASALLRQADSFIVIAAIRKDVSGIDVPVMAPVIANSYQSVEGGLLAELQLSRMATYSHEELIVQAIRDTVAEDESGRS